MRAFGVNSAFDPCRVLGVTTLDVVRASTFIAEINHIEPECVDIPVIGGHSGITIVPLLSQSNPPVNLCHQEEVETLTKRIQEAGTEVVKAKAGGGSATLSMAFAAARMTNSILNGLMGKPTVECAYVASMVTEAEYFSNPVELGENGIQRNFGYGELTEYEAILLTQAVPELQKNIKAGVKFVNK